MDNHNEETKYLYFGKRKFDVSNVPYKRIQIASTIWNETISKEGVTAEEINKMSESVGLYLIRQPFIVLNRRFTFFKSIIEILRRLFLTSNYIGKSNKEQYEEFQDWVYFVLTGKKKELLTVQNGVLELIQNQIIEMTEKTNLSLEQCLELLQTLAVDQTNPLIQYIQDHRA